MKILIAPDKFKGSLSAQGVCEALSNGILKKYPEAEIINKPMADGGDGSLMVLNHYFDLENITIEVDDPLWRPIEASYKMAGSTAYIEMAAASGLALLKEEERDCRATSSVGTGALILDAIQKGATNIYLFIGGSATNDGGTGIAYALGYRFYNKRGTMLAPKGEHLGEIISIHDTDLLFDSDAISFNVICDVNNPFYGKNGAAYIYASQKGAKYRDIKFLDQGLRNLAEILKKEGYKDIAHIPGAGAAGGVGGGAIAFLDAELKSGIQTFIEITELEAAVKACDLIITGEGKLDSQTEQGKVISGVCQLAKQYQKQVIAVCGDADFPVSKDLGIEEVYTVMSKAKSLGEAMSKTAVILKEIGAEIAHKRL